MTVSNYNPLVDSIESISSKIIGDMSYHGKKIVLLDDAVAALEELEKNLSAIYQREIDRLRMVQTSDYRLLM